jgi:N-acetyl sugar amidotransferase
VRYCVRCILPDTRPGLTLDQEGVCSACRGHDDKERRIDWVARGAAFACLVEAVKARGAAYDCVVPVSGGKDSWYQVITAQRHGLKPLGVTWRPPGRTALGQRNLDAMIAALRIDHIDYTLSPETERRFMKAALERKGASAIPMHLALFAIPIRLATQLGIPLIVWGENPQLEFGGSEPERLATELDLDWVRDHGVSNGTAVEDWIGAEGLSAGDLAAYRLPAPEAFRAGVRSIFLGSFFKWSSFDNARIAAEHGFAAGEAPLTGAWNFADLDDRFISIHHFLKWHKFGFTRAFDNLSVQVRFGRTSRAEAIATVRALGIQEPRADIAAFCDFIGEPVRWFDATAERFRNPAIWHRRGNRWAIEGFLIEAWDWSA